MLNIPLSLYIHIPWCVRKCPYCDFNSHEQRGDHVEQTYVDALLQDLDEQLPRIKDRRLTSIFFGGGTPSLFAPASIERILLGVQARLNYHTNIEITLEANPGTIDQKNFKDFRSAGVNRLSLGIQSLQDDKLRALGRIHDKETALRAIDYAQHCGFDNLNLDLMYGLPEQTPADALADLQAALNFKTPHLSWYQLTIEPNTVFYRYPPVLPQDEIIWDMQMQGQQLLTEHGLNQYEVSAYSRDEFNCQHNRNYWEFGDYLGIGAGAHSKITEQEKIIRHSQVKQPKDYLNSEKKKTAQTLVLSENDIIFEFMLNGLRLTEGIAANLFTERTGLTMKSIEKELLIARRKNLLLTHPDYWVPTELGKRFLNDLVGIFLPPNV